MQKEVKKKKENILLLNEIEEKIKDINSKEKIRKYTKGKLLGKGGFAHCYELICQENNKVFAAKVFNKDNLKDVKKKLNLLSEIKIQKSLHHNHVVAFEHTFEDKDYSYILLELCENQTLEELLTRRKTLTELEVQCYAIQLIKGLQYLHSHKIIHRDIKLGNLFLTDKMELKIGDFGLATKLGFDGEIKTEVLGTPSYMAPEIFNQKHSYEVDIWAIGIVIYMLLIGKKPFEANDFEQNKKKILELNYSFPENPKISYTAKKLIKKILVKLPARPTLDEILMDDFFNQGSSIPKLLPLASLASSPSLEYIKRFIPNLDENGLSLLNIEQKLEEEKMKNLNEKELKEAKESKEPKDVKSSNETKESKDPKDVKASQGTNEQKEPKDIKASQGTKSSEETKEATNSIMQIKEKKKENSSKESLEQKYNKTIGNTPMGAANSNNKINQSIINEKVKNKEIYVSKWVDYSSKYGIGYILNNNLIGVYFNDYTKLIYNPRSGKISFIERKVTKGKDMLYTFGLKEAPKELAKKVLIFLQFKKYFEEEKNDKDEKSSSAKIDRKKKAISDKNVSKRIDKKEEKKEDKKEEKEEESIFLTKWMKTNQAIIFRLSNKTIQVIFKDRSEIILFGDKIIYKDISNQIKNYKVEDALNSSNFEMIKRIKYVLNLFSKTISFNSQKNKTLN